MLTACGIETRLEFATPCLLQLLVATVLTACGIETDYCPAKFLVTEEVATVLTACGIETRYSCLLCRILDTSCNSAYRLRY